MSSWTRPVRSVLAALLNPLCVLGALAVVAVIGLVRLSQLQGRIGATGALRRAKGPPGPPIHVCLCSDDRDLRPASAAIKSAAVSARDPDRLVFHYITTPQLADRAANLFKEHLPGIRVEVHHNATLDSQLLKMIKWRKSSKARWVLASPFNFAPFYLDAYLSGGGRGAEFAARRLIYLDTDTLILGDLAEVHDMEMKGHPCAAVQHCLQRFENYINFDELKALGFEGVYDPKSCIANRGIFVIDVPMWKKKNITGKIEDWMERYRTAQKDLWFGGMSQPPWLLAMNGDYMELGHEWNCNSLGRDSMSMWESITLRKNGLDHKALRDLGVKYGPYGSIQPYIVTCSSTAKLLHYNGEMKPWVADRLRRQSPACSLPASVENNWKFIRTVRIYCDDVTFVRCSELWSLFITKKADDALRDFESEWVEEEHRWADQKREDREKMDEIRRERDKQAREEQAKRDKEEQEKAEKEKKQKEAKKKKKAKERARKEEAAKAAAAAAGAAGKDAVAAPPPEAPAPAQAPAPPAPTAPAAPAPGKAREAAPQDEAAGQQAAKKAPEKEKSKKDAEKKAKQKEEQERNRREQEEREIREREEAADEEAAAVEPPEGQTHEEEEEEEEEAETEEDKGEGGDKKGTKAEEGGAEDEAGEAGWGRPGAADGEDEEEEAEETGATRR